VRAGDTESEIFVLDWGDWGQGDDVNDEVAATM
jgi:hypothetical protein